MKKLVLTLLTIMATLQLSAQPFISDIQKFRQQDSVSMPEKNQILS